MRWPFASRRTPPWRLLRRITQALEGIHAELTTLRTDHDRAVGLPQGRAFRTSLPGSESRPLVLPGDLEGGFADYQAARDRLVQATGREPDDDDILREIDRTAA